MKYLSLFEAARRAPNQVALIVHNEAYTFLQLADHVQRQVHALQQQGIRKRLAMHATNQRETVVLLYACFELGIEVVLLHPKLKKSEAEIIIEDAAPEKVVDPSLCALTPTSLCALTPTSLCALTPSPSPTGRGEWRRHSFEALTPNPSLWALTPRRRGGKRRREKKKSDQLSSIAQRSSLSSPLPVGEGLGVRAHKEGFGVRARKEQPGPSNAVMIYTSGTTGRSKGAVLTHDSLIASAEASEANLGWLADDRWLVSIPICHVGGLSILTRCLLAQKCVVLHSKFDAEEILSSIAQHKVTLISLVPTTLRLLLDHDSTHVLQRIRAILLGGAAASRSLLEECAVRGLRVITTYGLTEACSQVTAQAPLDSSMVREGVGKPLQGVKLAILDEHGRTLPPNTVGQIAIQGPMLMLGYWQKDRVMPFDRQRWFETGDLGELDVDGTLYVHTRRTDLIVTGGENVYPVEIEQALEALPWVHEAIVFGIPDVQWGQLVAVAIVGQSVNESKIYHALVERFASYKVPRRICFMPALPKLFNGKVNRVEAIQACSSQVRGWNVSE